jgi:RND family efflux transporter MFP subunit
MTTLRTSLAALGVALTLAACQEQQAAPLPPVRPVLSVIAAPQKGQELGFVGTVEPQIRSSFGFRVLGRMVTRAVNVGDTVKKGTQLAALDPVAFELAVRSSQAEVSNALAQLENATATETRQRTLLDQGTTTEAQFEAAQQAREAAAAAVTRARANLAKTQEQFGYTQLRADFDGVVTAVEAEVGQVVQPGQTVVTLARPDIREAVVDVPETVNGSLQLGSRFDVALQLDPSVRASGRVREIAPQADPTTRTRRVRITLDNPPANFRLGTTVTAVLETATHATSIELPASALLERDGTTMVWVVDPATKTVSTQSVKVATRGERSFQVVEGLAPGTRVVTAGVNSLTPGQQVKIADGASQ